MRCGPAALLLMVSLAAGPVAKAAGPFNALAPAVPVAVQDSSGIAHPQRWLAAALTLTVGPFGGHRVYLGTRPTVPLLYSLTFGGFGVLVLIDLGHVLFTRDLAPYQENGQVFMWRRPEAAAVTPP